MLGREDCTSSFSHSPHFPIPAVHHRLAVRHARDQCARTGAEAVRILETEYIRTDINNETRDPPPAGRVNRHSPHSAVGLPNSLLYAKCDHLSCGIRSIHCAYRSHECAVFVCIQASSPTSQRTTVTGLLASWRSAKINIRERLGRICRTFVFCARARAFVFVCPNTVAQAGFYHLLICKSDICIL